MRAVENGAAARDARRDHRDVRELEVVQIGRLRVAARTRPRVSVGPGARQMVMLAAEALRSHARAVLQRPYN